MLKNNKQNNTLQGFTIVELLVVIVVIGILAAITVTSYRGVTQQAIAASAKLDLSNFAKQLKLYNIDNGLYPDEFTKVSNTYCPAGSTPADNRYCVKADPGNTYDYVSDAPFKTFTITAIAGVNTNSPIIYETTDNNSQPQLITPQPLEAISVVGAAEDGSTLNTTTTPSAAAVSASYQWKRADNLAFSTNITNISGATSSTYILTSADIGKYIRATVTGTTRYPGSPSSNVIGPIVASPWLTIGTQSWARTNLNIGTKVSTYLYDSYSYENENEEMVSVNLFRAGTNNGVIEKECYGNLESNCTTHGGLYSWDEIMKYATTEGAQGICPVGSHVPTDNDWKILEKQLGMTQAQADGFGWRGTDQATKLKAGGSSGFNTPLAGFRPAESSTPYGFNSYTGFWTSTQSNGMAFSRYIYGVYPTVNRGENDKSSGFYVRCIRN